MAEIRTTAAYVSVNPRAGFVLCTDQNCSVKLRPHYHEAQREATSAISLGVKDALSDCDFDGGWHQGWWDSYTERDGKALVEALLRRGFRIVPVGEPDQ